MPLQLPVLAVSFCPSCAVPEMLGAAVLTGGQLDCRDRQDGFDEADPASPKRMATEKETARLLAAKRDIGRVIKGAAFPTSPQVVDCFGRKGPFLERNPSIEAATRLEEILRGVRAGRLASEPAVKSLARGVDTPHGMIGPESTEPLGTDRGREEQFDGLCPEPVSPELVLVAPPDLAQRARNALRERYEFHPTSGPGHLPLVRLASDVALIDQPTDGLAHLTRELAVPGAETEAPSSARPLGPTNVARVMDRAGADDPHRGVVRPCHAVRQDWLSAGGD